jgi:hypothetical protein
MDINEVLNALAEGDSVLVAHPDALRRLEELGAEIKRSTPLSPDQELQKLFRDREAAASSLLQSIPSIPGGILAAVILLYDEIIEALLFGLHGAAITLSGILVEFALKFTTYIVETGSATSESFDPSKWNELENIAMVGAIRRARKAGLIADDHEAKLLAFKDSVRNPYSHYNIRRICKPWGWANVRKLNLDTGEITVEDSMVADDPVLQAQAKPEIDRRESLRVFAFADRVVQHVFAEAWRIVGAGNERSTT